MNEDQVIKRIDGAIRFFIYLMIFWLPYSPAVIESSVVIALFLWIIKRFLLYAPSRQERSFRAQAAGVLGAFRPIRTPLDMPILFFIGICLLSTMTSQYAGISLLGFLTKTLEWFIVFYLVVEVFREKKHILIALSIFVFTSFATAIDSIIQYHFTKKDLFFGYELVRDKATGSFKHPNSLGAYLTIVVPSALSLLFLPLKSLWKKSGIIIINIICLWSLCVSSSRGAWSATGFGILILFLLKRKRKIIWTGFLMFVVLFSFLVSRPVWNNMGLEEKVNDFKGTAEWRIGLWEDSFKMIRERPFLGHGLNTFMGKFQEYRRKYNGQHPYSPSYAHNCYVQMAAETGFLGLAGFLWILLTLGVTAGSCIVRNKTERELSNLMAGLFSGQFAFLVHSFLDVDFYSLQLSVYFWLIVGIIMSIYTLLRADKSGEIL